MLRKFVLAVILGLFASPAYAVTVYYCSQIENLTVKDHDLRTVSLEKFKFMVDENEVRFGDSGYFAETSMQVSWWSSHENWDAQDDSSILKFMEGEFFYADVYRGTGNVGTAKIITARCEKF